MEELQAAADAATARATAAEGAVEREQHARKAELQEAKVSYDARAKELSEQVRVRSVRAAVTWWGHFAIACPGTYCRAPFLNCWSSACR